MTADVVLAAVASRQDVADGLDPDEVAAPLARTGWRVSGQTNARGVRARARAAASVGPSGRRRAGRAARDLERDSEVKRGIGLLVTVMTVASLLQVSPAVAQSGCIGVDMEVSPEKVDLLTDLAKRFNDSDRANVDDECIAVRVQQEVVGRGCVTPRRGLARPQGERAAARRMVAGGERVGRGREPAPCRSGQESRSRRPASRSCSRRS